MISSRLPKRRIGMFLQKPHNSLGHQERRFSSVKKGPGDIEFVMLYSAPLPQEFLLIAKFTFTNGII